MKRKKVYRQIPHATIFEAYIKKLLGIQSPSLRAFTCGRYKYEFDYWKAKYCKSI